jgi:hypothetical protein
VTAYGADTLTPLDDAITHPPKDAHTAGSSRSCVRDDTASEVIAPTTASSHAVSVRAGGAKREPGPLSPRMSRRVEDALVHTSRY